MIKVNMQKDVTKIIKHLKRQGVVFIPCNIHYHPTMDKAVYGYLLNWDGNDSGYNVDLITVLMVTQQGKHNSIIASYVWYKDVDTYKLCLKSIIERCPALDGVDGYLVPLDINTRGDVFYKYLQFINFEDVS